MNSLKKYKEHLSLLMAADMDTDTRDIKLAGLMTEMEHEFRIPILSDMRYEQEHLEVMILYRKISNSRSL